MEALATAEYLLEHVYPKNARRPLVALALDVNDYDFNTHVVRLNADSEALSLIEDPAFEEGEREYDRAMIARLFNIEPVSVTREHAQFFTIAHELGHAAASDSSSPEQARLGDMARDQLYADAYRQREQLPNVFYSENIDERAATHNAGYFIQQVFLQNVQAFDDLEQYVTPEYVLGPNGFRELVKLDGDARELWHVSMAGNAEMPGSRQLRPEFRREPELSGLVINSLTNYWEPVGPDELVTDQERAYLDDLTYVGATLNTAYELLDTVEKLAVRKRIEQPSIWPVMSSEMYVVQCETFAFLNDVGECLEYYPRASIYEIIDAQTELSTPDSRSAERLADFVSDHPDLYEYREPTSDVLQLLGVNQPLIEWAAAEQFTLSSVQPYLTSDQALAVEAWERLPRADRRAFDDLNQVVPQYLSDVLTQAAAYPECHLPQIDSLLEEMADQSVVSSSYTDWLSERMFERRRWENEPPWLPPIAESGLDWITAAQGAPWYRFDQTEDGQLLAFKAWQAVDGSPLQQVQRVGPVSDTHNLSVLDTLINRQPLDEVLFEVQQWREQQIDEPDSFLAEGPPNRLGRVAAERWLPEL